LQRAGRNAPDSAELQPDLAEKPDLSEAEGGVERVVGAWRRLPRHVKAAIVTLVNASSGQ